MLQASSAKFSGPLIIGAVLATVAGANYLTAEEPTSHEQLISDVLNAGLEKHFAISIDATVGNCKIQVERILRKKCSTEHRDKTVTDLISLDEISDILEVQTSSRVMPQFNFDSETWSHMEAARSKYLELAVPTDGLPRAEVMKIASDTARQHLQSNQVVSNETKLSCSNEESLGLPTSSISYFVSNKNYSGKFGAAIQDYLSYCNK